MFTHERSVPRTRLVRVAVTAAAAAFLVLAGGFADAVAADTPQGWEVPPHVSGLEYLLVLLLIPLGLAAIISLLVLLPTLAGDPGYQPGQAWRSQTEWFGGPRRGVEAADELSPEQLEARSSGTGSTSGRW